MNGAQEDDDPHVYLLALRRVVEVHSNLKDVALQSNLSENLISHPLCEGKSNVEDPECCIQSAWFRDACYPAGLRRDGGQRGGRTPDTKILNGVL